MNVLDDFRPRESRRPVILAIGFFDGVHRGHQRVIAAARREARRVRGETWILTFHPHPLKVLRPGEAPPMLTCTGHKLRLLGGLGVKTAIVLRFTRRLAAMEAGAFVRRLVFGIPALTTIYVGENWRFGRGGKGTPAVLSSLARECGVTVRVVTPVRWQGHTVSSTRVRAAVQQGHLAVAEAMLGRPFSILGTVVKGRGVGRTLGFPTANLDPHGEAAPPHGTYAVMACRGGRWCAGVLHVGVRPTFGGRPGDRSVFELHVPGWSGSLYGRYVEVAFGERLRGEKRFASPEHLQAQIRDDIAVARRLLSTSSRIRPCRCAGVC